MSETSSIQTKRNRKQYCTVKLVKFPVSGMLGGHVIKDGLDWIGKTWTGLIKHGVKTVKLIQKLSPREELHAPVQGLTLVEKPAGV